MHAGTLYDTGARTIEVRIYRNDRLLVRKTCESREEAAAIVEQASDLDHVYLLVDGSSPDHGPGDLVTRHVPRWGGDEDQPLASLQLPGYGTE